LNWKNGKSKTCDLKITGMNPKQFLRKVSAASCGVLYPPLRGIVQLTNSDTLRFRNWSFTIKDVFLSFFIEGLAL